MKRYADVISGSVLALVGAIFLIETRNIQAIMKMEFGPKVMPRIISVLLIVLGVIIAGLGLHTAKTYPEKSQSRNFHIENVTGVLLTAVCLVFYIIALQPLGFLATSIVFLFAQFAVLGGVAHKKRLLFYAIISIVVSIGIYLLFTRVFGVLLPAGRIW